MRLKKRLLEVMCSLAVMASTLAVNCTCHYHFYQEQLSPQLDSLKKYYEK